MKHYILLLALLAFSCVEKVKESEQELSTQLQVGNSKMSLYILGTVQDGGSPHIGCQKSCCKELFTKPDNTRKVVSLGVVDHENGTSYLFEATPDITTQLKLLKQHSKTASETPDGIFLTHAHIGHYTGLMYLGREALSTNNVKVYAMPKMKVFLETNGPWNQLVTLKNIDIQPIENEKSIKLSKNLSVVPFTVPHRDEYSETVGYKINGPNKSVLFIPDIDKWSKWEKDILTEVQQVDFAFLDASFFDGDEINSRNIEEIPHPFVVESMELFRNLPAKEKDKIHFIHFNHTNALLNIGSEQYKTVIGQGFNISTFNQRIDL